MGIHLHLMSKHCLKLNPTSFSVYGHYPKNNTFLARKLWERHYISEIRGVFVICCLLGMKMSRLVNDHNDSIKPSSFIVNGKFTQIHDDGCLSIIISFGSCPYLNRAH